MPRTDWSEVLNRAATIVDEYDTPVTLRQLSYRLVANGILLNWHNAYKTHGNRAAVTTWSNLALFVDLQDVRLVEAS